MGTKFKSKKLSYNIKAIEIFGIIITTRKQLENCNYDLDLEIQEKDQGSDTNDTTNIKC